MFKRYSSLTNHYMSKDIDFFKQIHSNKLDQTNWIVQEKIHGANVSFLFTPNETVKIFSRNQQVDETFYSATDVFNDTINSMEAIQVWSNIILSSVRVFGELHGSNIQKGVDYGKNKVILFYDMQVDDIQKSQLYFETFFDNMDLGGLMVPNFGIFPTLESALEFDILRDTELSDKKDNLIEGVTIKPYETVLSDKNGSLFYIKHKNEKFKESQRPKKVRIEIQYSDVVNQWRKIFLSYFHEERCESTFSKEGRIESLRELNKFIPLIHADALETFLKEEDYPEKSFTKLEQKYILNSSNIIVDLLKGYM